MESGRSVKPQAYTRAWVAIMLIVVCSLAAFTGFLLWLAPAGPRSGQLPLLLGLTKSQWGDVHFWISMAALAVALIHVAIDWRALRGCIRYLTSVHRSPRLVE